MDTSQLFLLFIGIQSTGASSSHDAHDTRKSRLDRFKNLELKMNEARKMNHQEVVEEDRRKKLPANFEQKRKFIDWEEQEEKKRKEAEARGEDYDRVKLLEITADEAEKWERKKKKKNPDPGFSGYEAATHRAYQRNTKSLKPDLQEVARQKRKLGDDFYAGTNTLGLNQVKDNPEAVNRMVDDLEKQIAKRAKFHRRRTHDEDADIDFINERNAKFNKKLERFYGSYTDRNKTELGKRDSHLVTKVTFCGNG